MTTEEEEAVAWVHTGTFLDQLNGSIQKLSESVDRSTAVTSALDQRLTVLEEKVNSVSANQWHFGSSMTSFGGWIYNQRKNPVVVVPITALAVKYVPELAKILVDVLKQIAG